MGIEAAGRSGSQGADPVTTAVARDLGFDSVDEMPPVTRVEGMKGWISSVLQHKWRTKPGVLGMLTPEQLGKVFKHAQVKRFTDTNNRMASRLHEIQQAAGRIIKHWDGLAQRHGKAADTQYARVALESTRLRMWPHQPLASKANAHLFKGLAVDGDAYKARMAELAPQHAALEAQYNALPADYKRLYDTHNGYFADMREAVRAAQHTALIDSMLSEASGGHGLSEAQLREAVEKGKDRKSRAAFLKASGYDKLQQHAVRSLWKDVAGVDAIYQANMDGPYMPLIRFGDHVVTMKSERFQQVEQQLKDAMAQADQLRNVVDTDKRMEVEGRLDAARIMMEGADLSTRSARAQDVLKAKAAYDSVMGQVAKADEAIETLKATLDELKSNSRHYAVEFHESLADAEGRRAALTAQSATAGNGAKVEQQVKAEYFRHMDGASNAYVDKVASILADSMPKEQAQRMIDTMREVQYQMAPDNSMAKSQISRKSVAGAKPEELRRSFAKYGERVAYGVSRMEHKGKLQRALNALRTDPDSDARLVANELGAQMEMNMAQVNNPLVNALASASHLTYLAGSPAYVLVNATQPWLVSLPVLSGRYGMARAAREMAAGMKTAADVMKVSYKSQPKAQGARRSFNFDLDIAGAEKAGSLKRHEAKLLRELSKRGRLEITVNHDLGAVSSGAATDGGIKGAVSKMSEFMSVPSRQAEVMNRVGTALAAYRMEYDKAVKNGKTHAEADIEATNYADRSIEETHFNYAPENAPRHMHGNKWGGYGRLAFQFRKYQQHVVFLWTSNIMKASKSLKDADGMSAAEIKEARKTLAYLTGTALAASGASGMFGASLASAVIQGLYNAFTDDDEEKDLAQAAYMGLKSSVGEFAADAITRGVPAAFGLDLSQRVGHGEALSPVPFADERKEGGDKVMDAAFKFAFGAPGGMIYNWGEAAKYAAEGDGFKAAQRVLPKVFADPVRALDMQVNGIRNSKGTTLVTPENTGMGTKLARAIGFGTTGTGRMWDGRVENAKQDEAVKRARDRVIKKALSDGYGGASEAIAEFNRKHPGDKVTLKVVNDARKRRQRDQQNLANGVRVTKQNQQRLREQGYLE